MTIVIAVVCFPDFKSAIRALQSNSSLDRACSAALQIVNCLSGHAGVSGNKKADELVQMATQNPLVKHNQLSTLEITAVIRKK